MSKPTLFLLAFSVGAGLGILMEATQPRTWSWINVLLSGVVGLAIASSMEIAMILGRPWLARLEGGWRTVARALIFVVAGWIGWLAVVSLLEFAGIMEGALRANNLVPSLAIAGSIALIVGLIVVGFEQLKDRLEESVARLKEAEYAERELELARTIQQRLLPPDEIDQPGLRIGARNLPARWVAGDFYDVFPLGDSAIGVAVADVVGKGMGASLIMASVKAMLPLVAADRPVAEVLGVLNDRLVGELAQREFVALAYLRFDPASGEFEMANAGMPDPFLLSPDGSNRMLEAPGPRLPLGLRPGLAYETVSGRLVPGDRVLLFSDGLPEAPNAAGEPLGYEAFAELLPTSAADPKAWLDELFERLRRATASSSDDDLTAVVLERTADFPADTG